MKNIIYLLLLLSIMPSCNKDDDEVEYSEDKTMTAKLDGNLWKAVEPKGGKTIGLYSISGESKIGHKIILYIDTIAIGVYDLSTTSIPKAEYIMPDDGGFYVTQGGTGTSGYIKIEKVDTIMRKITGEFYFVANEIGTYSQKTISNGEFENVEYY